jgi:hypothetical protein
MNDEELEVEEAGRAPWSSILASPLAIRSVSFCDYLTMKVTLNGKTLDYKVLDLVKSYNFHIKFTSIRVQTKKNYKFLKKD